MKGLLDSGLPKLARSSKCVFFLSKFCSVTMSKICQNLQKRRPQGFWRFSPDGFLEDGTWCTLEAKCLFALRFLSSYFSQCYFHFHSGEILTGYFDREAVNQSANKVFTVCYLCHHVQLRPTSASWTTSWSQVEITTFASFLPRRES